MKLILGQILTVISAALLTSGIMYGIGRHMYYLDTHQQTMAFKLDLISQPFSILSAGFGKVSIALLLLRIMVKNKPRQYFLYGLIACLMIINVVCIIIIMAQCSPVSALWDFSIKGRCWSPMVQRDYGFFQSCKPPSSRDLKFYSTLIVIAFSALTDLVLALFPVILIWNLKMKKNVKVGLASAMSLGVL